jgi:hypothetical protein
LDSMRCGSRIAQDSRDRLEVAKKVRLEGLEPPRA